MEPRLVENITPISTENVLESEKYLNMLTFVVFKGQSPTVLKEITFDVIPDEVGYSYSANWVENSPLGRISPIYQYVNGSEKKYTFSIVIHEDMINSKQYKSLVHLIDEVKSMSYPVFQTLNGVSNIMSLPKIYFTLGELFGYCIVNTNISWMTPFRNGRYTQAQISFDILVDSADDALAKNRTVDMERTDDLTSVLYNNGVVSTMTSEYQSNIAKFMVDNYGTAISDLEDPSNSAAIIEASKAFAVNEFNRVEGRLEEIYGLFQEALGTDSRINAIQGIKDISKINVDSTQVASQYANSGSNALSTQVTKLKTDFVTFLDDYYNTFDEDLTRAEYNIIKEEVFMLLEWLGEISKEVVGYGASS